MKTLSIIISVIALLVFNAYSKEADLKDLSIMVNDVNEMLAATQHVAVVKTLFSLTDKADIDTAVQCLQRPRCLEMYEQMFSIISKIAPVQMEHPRMAYYEFENLKLSYSTFPKMEIRFISDGKKWVFHDPSFERKLKRKLTPEIK